jgi:hypothetical protein
MRAQAGQPGAAAVEAQPPARPVLEQMAQELYRVVLFAVFYAQVCLLGLVPYVGEKSRLKPSLHTAFTHASSTS